MVLEIIPNLLFLSLVDKYHVLELVLLPAFFAWGWLFLLIRVILV